MDYLTNMFSLENKTVLITGGGGVIAGALAAGFLNAGARLMLWGRGEESLTEITDQLNSPQVHTLKVDVCNEQEVQAAIAETVKITGLPDILVNAVGGNKGKSAFIDMNVADFESILKLNITAGLVIPTKHMAAAWIKAGIKGAIINLASMSSYVPLSGVWAYDAAKAAVLNLTVATAREFAEYGIRVNAIAPGFFIGKQNKALLIKDEATGELTERGKAVIAHTPFKRFGDIKELTGAALFLASAQAAGFVTGVTIPVDGGYLTYNI